MLLMSVDLAPQALDGVAMRPREFQASVVAIEPVMGDAALLSLKAPSPMAETVRAGQFIDVLCRSNESFDPLLRRPYSIYRASPVDGTLTILVRPFGRGSAWLVERRLGEEMDVLGPLGNTFTVATTSRNLLMVAGGVGAAPLVMLAEDAVARGLSVTYLMGAADESGLLTSSELPSTVEYVVATDDGSRGHRGFVTDLIPDYVRWADQIFTCGPEAMFRSLRAVILPLRIGRTPTVQVSMERSMACGLGACLGCVVETKTGMSASCVQGPVYDMDDVVW
ncbi:MAG: dihydroorotate dehydrogenase electron transfer subunit [Thermomicrobiales bacterium]